MNYLPQRRAFECVGITGIIAVGAGTGTGAGAAAASGGKISASILHQMGAFSFLPIPLRPGLRRAEFPFIERRAVS